MKISQFTLQQHQEIMQIALRLAKNCLYHADLPVGAIVFHPIKGIIGFGHNMMKSKNNPLLHAEMIAINASLEQEDRFILQDCGIYTTLQPCPMCYGAIMHVGINKVIFGAYSDCQEWQKIGSSPACFLEGILEKDCSQLISDFFSWQRHRTRLHGEKFSALCEQ